MREKIYLGNFLKTKIYRKTMKWWYYNNSPDWRKYIATRLLRYPNCFISYLLIKNYYINIESKIYIYITLLTFNISTMNY